MRLSKIARCVVTDSIALILLLLIGLIISLVSHVPPAITLLQVLAVELLVLTYPISNLVHDKSSRKQRHLTDRQVYLELAIFGVLAAVIAYANYRFFFARHGLSPAFIDTAHPLYMQATALTCLTIIGCQFMNLLLVRSDERKKFFTNHIWQNKQLVMASGVSLFFILNLIYNPIFHWLFGTAGLGIIDWLTVLVSAAVYTGLRLFQRHTRNHTRHAVINLHHKVHSGR